MVLAWREVKNHLSFIPHGLFSRCLSRHNVIMSQQQPIVLVFTFHFIQQKSCWKQREVTYPLSAEQRFGLRSVIFYVISTLPLLFWVWFVEQQYSYHPRTWEKSRISGTIWDLPNQNLHFNKFSRWFMCIWNLEKHWAMPHGFLSLWIVLVYFKILSRALLRSEICSRLQNQADKIHQTTGWWSSVHTYLVIYTCTNVLAPPVHAYTRLAERKRDRDRNRKREDLTRKRNKKYRYWPRT